VRLFFDSGAFIARAIVEDAHHEAAVDTFQRMSQGRLPYRLHYTSNYVVDETATFLLYERGPRAAIETLKRIRSSPALRVLHVSEDVEALADKVFERFASSRVSYTDCTTKVLMERESIDIAFSFDRGLEVLGFRRIP
jgi:hypothetical protein